MIITLGVPKELRFGFKALKMVEELTEKSITEIMKETENSETNPKYPYMDQELFQKIMYCGLCSEDKELKYEDVPDLLDRANYNYVWGKLYDSLAEAFGYGGQIETEDEPKEESKEDKKK